MDAHENQFIVHKSARHAIEQASEGYSNRVWLRALVSLVPQIGGSLDILLTHKHAKIVQDRIEHLLSSFGSEVERINSQSINREYLESEEWHDLFQLALERGSRLKDRERISAIARILGGAVDHNRDFTIHPVDLVQTLSDLSDQEALVLRWVNVLYTERRDLLTGSNNTLFTEKTLTSLLPEALRPSVAFLLARLEGKGLISSLFEYYGMTDAAEQLFRYLRPISSDL